MLVWAIPPQLVSWGIIFLGFSTMNITVAISRTIPDLFHLPNSHRFKRVLQGLLLSIGSPLGWLIISVVEGTPVLQALGGNVGLYLYLSISTAAVFMFLGAYIGANEERLMSQALVDQLTGIYNNRYFHEHLHIEYSRARRRNEALSLILIDLDHFKRINDNYGHVVGDKLLRRVAQAMKHCSREWETVARVGGEEFCVILATCNQQQAFTAAERFRQVVSQAVVNSEEGKDVRITASAGIATSGDVVGNEWDLYAAADKAMYQAKESGRNRCCAYEITEVFAH